MGGVLMAFVFIDSAFGVCTALEAISSGSYLEMTMALFTVFIAGCCFCKAVGL